LQKLCIRNFSFTQKAFFKCFRREAALSLVAVAIVDASRASWVSSQQWKWMALKTLLVF